MSFFPTYDSISTGKQAVKSLNIYLVILNLLCMVWSLMERIKMAS